MPVHADIEQFRSHVKSLLREARENGSRAGYSSETTKRALFAVVALLDESVLNFCQSLQKGWAQKPLQEELFGEHVAGEVFFGILDGLLGDQDSDELGDLLEVFQLCLVLGFEGRYGAGRKAELRRYQEVTSEKIYRIRGADRFSPDWAPPSRETLPEQKDRWLPRLVRIAVSMAVLAILLFVVFTVSLDGRVRDLQEILAGVSP